MTTIVITAYESLADYVRREEPKATSRVTGLAQFDDAVSALMSQGLYLVYKEVGGTPHIKKTARLVVRDALAARMEAMAANNTSAKED